MHKVLVAGATGYLGKYVVAEFKRRGYWVRAFVRNPKKLDVTGPFLEPAVRDLVDEVVVGDVTKPDTLKGICDGIDVVFSSVGITKPNEKASFMDVDYGGNKSLLEEALKAGVKKFIFISVYRAQDFLDIEILKAREMFVSLLEKSGMDYTVVRPTGFFSDMTEFLQMAYKGRVYLFGSGENKINPIHGADLAKVCVDAADSKEREVPIGGPEVFKFVDIAELAFDVLGKKPKITRIPAKPVKAFVALMRPFSKKYYTLMKFFLTAMTHDFVAPKTGTHKLKDYFVEVIKSGKFE
ncbi:MAG: SDR family oxidoreductase [Candidatus Njordarchaeia archaeon]